MKRSKNNKKLLKIKYNLIKYIILLFLFIFLIILIITNKLLNSIDYNIQVNLNEVYLAIDESIKIESNIDDVTYKSLDEDIAKVNDGVIIGISKGKTYIQVKKFNSITTIKVNVSDLYTVDTLNNDKEYLICNEYTEEDNLYLDRVLVYKINNVGYKTRAAVVEAARFLTLEFPKRIHYFYENGRLLTNGTRDYVDGEGRYYHVGLYLSDSKKDSIISSKYGPSIWGCSLYTKILSISTPNGLDCSGFVSWVLLNAGFDVGDVGAGISKNKTNDLDDLGDKIKIKEISLDKVKVGDLLSRDGHIGILIGKDNDNFYVAEALDYDLHVLTLSKKELLNSDWTYFINLDKLYKTDGNLNNMW